MACDTLLISEYVTHISYSTASDQCAVDKMTTIGTVRMHSQCAGYANCNRGREYCQTGKSNEQKV